MSYPVSSLPYYSTGDAPGMISSQTWGLNKKNLAEIALVCLLFVAGCVNPAPVSSITPPPASSPAVPTSLPSATAPADASAIPGGPSPSPSPFSPTQAQDSTPTPAATAPSQVPAQYTLEASFDYFAHSISVTEQISYTNLTTSTLSDLLLVVEANRWVGSFSLSSLTWADGENVQAYDLNGAQLKIPLLDPLAAGDKLGIKLAYQLFLPEIPPPSDVTRPVPFGYTERQTNIVDWYPYIPPYDAGTGWLVHRKWAFGEHQVFDLADFAVKLKLIEPVQNLVIAASAPAQQDKTSYTYHLEAARTFALSASNQYVVKTTTVGDVSVNAYTFPYDQSAGDQVLQDTAAALAVYDQLLTPYHRASLSVVEADFLDGMEFEGLYFLSRGFYNLYDGTPMGYLTFIAAHETAHQWWYAAVGNDQALEPWLDEALCTYMEHVFYENVYPDLTTSSGQSVLDWWWYYRVNFYDPTGWVDGSVYDFSLFRPYRDAVYLNGAKFLQDLRTLIGDDAFFAFLKDYATRENHHIATAADFFNILRLHTSKDITPLLNTYFHYNR